MQRMIEQEKTAQAWQREWPKAYLDISFASCLLISTMREILQDNFNERDGHGTCQSQVSESWRLRMPGKSSSLMILSRHLAKRMDR